jgi:hypothetical protein
MLQDDRRRNGADDGAPAESADAVPSLAERYAEQVSALPTSNERFQRAKRSYVTRRIDLDPAAMLLTSRVAPRTGDLVLARIERLGNHRRLESPHGRRQRLNVGDEVLLCYGARYATDQFHAIVPDSLKRCHMVAAGGIAGLCVDRNANIKSPTKISPIGLVATAEGTPINLADFALPAAPSPAAFPRTIAVVGTSMNAGKTTTAAALVHGLARAEKSVVVGKVTGTGAGGDRWAYVDAGAQEVLDFTDFGFASTYKLSGDVIEKLMRAMTNWMARTGPEVMVLEIADGLFFEETARLMQSGIFGAIVDDVILAASDTAGAIAGVRWLADRGMDPVAISGCITSSPLAVREAESILNIPILTADDLAGSAVAPNSDTAGLTATA